MKLYLKQYFYLAMNDWLHYFCVEWEGWALINWFNHTSWVTVVTPTDRPKSVRNSCVIKVFGGVFMLSCCFLDCSVGVGVFITGLSQISSFFSYSPLDDHWVILSSSKKYQRLFIKVYECLCFKCRAKNHISLEEPYFATFFYNCFQCFGINFGHFFDADGKLVTIKDRSLFLWKMKKLLEIKNMWRNMVTRQNVVLCFIYLRIFYSNSSYGEEVSVHSLFAAVHHDRHHTGHAHSRHCTDHRVI